MRLTTDRTIVLKDRRTLGFAEYDDPQGIPMLLFHGAPGSRLEGALFDRAAQAHHARILVADLPGYATSSAIRHDSLLGYVEDSIALVDALHIDTFLVLGVSAGWPFALACAANTPERVRCCGLLSATGPLTITPGSFRC